MYFVEVLGCGSRWRGGGVSLPASRQEKRRGEADHRNQPHHQPPSQRTMHESPRWSTRNKIRGSDESVLTGDTLVHSPSAANTSVGKSGSTLRPHSRAPSGAKWTSWWAGTRKKVPAPGLLVRLFCTTKAQLALATKRPSPVSWVLRRGVIESVTVGLIHSSL
jgi:hypothetical protein